MNPPPEDRTLERFEIQAAVLALLVAAAYANALGSSFHFDDYSFLTDPWIAGPGWGWNVFRLVQTRPLTFLTFHANYLLSGADPFSYHLVNVLLHAANSILVLALARRLLPRPGGALAALCAAAVFALHPLQTEAVTYVFTRSTLLSTHFALWTLWFFGRGKYLASAAMFGLSLLAKEETIALPGLLLLLAIAAHKRPDRRLWSYFALLIALAAAFAGRLFYVIHISAAPPDIGVVRGISAGQYLLTQTRVVWIYLRLLAAPYDLNLDRTVTLSTGLFSPWTTLPALLALMALLSLLAWLAWRGRDAALWALGFFILLAPSSSMVPLADLAFEHRTYLPMAAAALALGFLLRRVPRAKLTLGAALLAPVMLAGTIARNADWHDEKTLWTDIASKSPGKARSWFGLARAYSAEPAKAREYYEKALAIDPNYAGVHTSYGILLLASNQPADALVHFQRALEIAGPSADSWNNLGGVYYQLHDLTKAQDCFRRAVELNPCSYSARRNLMAIYSARNDRHAVWQAAEAPATCVLLPQQARELRALQLQAGTP